MRQMLEVKPLPEIADESWWMFSGMREREMRPPRQTTLALAAVMALTLVAADSNAAPPVIQAIGDLPGGGDTSIAYGVARGGVVVVGISESGAFPNKSVVEGFRWTPGEGIVGLGFFPLTDTSFARSVSSDGAIVAGSGGNLATRWTEESGLVSIGTLPPRPPPYNPLSRAYAISPDGVAIVGESLTIARQEAFRWTQDEGIIGLGGLTPSGDNGALGVSDGGEVVVGYARSSQGTEAFRWTAATGMVGLGGLGSPPYTSRAYAVSADGSTIVGSSKTNAGTTVAFRWTEATGMVALEPLPGATDSLARAVSGDGSVIVGDSGSKAFHWDALHGTRMLRDALAQDHGVDVSGWNLTQATAVADDGTAMAGYGSGPGPLHPYAGGWVVALPRPGVACEDGIDNDGNGLVDFPADSGCIRADDQSEGLDCADGLDNDSDGLVDMEDPGCMVIRMMREDPECNDGMDNDGDGLVDFPADDRCKASWDGNEATDTPSCGLLGCEILLILPYVALRRRRARESR